MPRLRAFAAAVVLVVAVAWLVQVPAGPPAPRPSSTKQPTAAPTPTPPAAVPTAAAPEGRLLLLDPRTLADLDTFPLRVVQWTVAGDPEVIAVAGALDGDQRSLALINRSNAAVRTVRLPATGDVVWLEVREDTVWWVASDGTAGTWSATGAAGPVRVAVNRHLWDARVLPDGRMAALLLPGQGTPPTLAVVDVAAGTVTHRPLPLRITDRALLPAVAWAPEDSRLYLAPTDQDRIMAVDAGTGAVVAEGALPPPAHRQVLRPLFTRWRLAAASGRVFATGTETGELQADPVTARQRRSLGLAVLDGSDLSVVATHELPVDDVAASPAGALLLATDLAGTHGGVRVIEAATATVRGRALRLQEVRVVGFGPEGRVAYLLARRAAAGTWRLHALDLDTMTLTGRRALPDGARVAPSGPALVLPPT